MSCRSVSEDSGFGVNDADLRLERGLHISERGCLTPDSTIIIAGNTDQAEKMRASYRKVNEFSNCNWGNC